MNPEIQGRLRNIEKFRQKQADEDMRAVLALPEGRRFFFRLVEDVCGLMASTSFGMTSDDTLRHEGRRSVGTDLVREVHRVDPRALVRAYSEMLEQRAEENERREAAMKDKAAGDQTKDEDNDA